MLILNDQLKDHLDNWDDDDSSVIGGDDDGTSWKTSQVEKNTSSVDDIITAETPDPESEPQGPLDRRLVHPPCLHNVETIGCGFFLGIWYCKNEAEVAGISLSTILLLVVVGTIVLLLLRHWRQWRSRQRDEAMQAQRLALSAVLGRIGGTLGNKQYHNVSNEMVGVATAFEHLLQTIHDAMERLQCATSMKLGLGIWSPSVHRVEQAARANRGSPSPVTGSSNTVLAKALQRSLSLFGQEEVDFPAVVTLSWLKSTRQSLVVAFSEFSWMDEVGDVSPSAVQLISRMQETTVHVQAYYGLDDPITSMEQERSHKNAFSAEVDQVAIHLHAAQIALWSYSHEQPGNDTSSKQEWINRFQLLLSAANAIQETLKTTSTVDQADTDNERTKSISKPRSISAQHPSSFEHEGQAGAESSVLPDSLAARQPVDKTLVFSGKGSVNLKRQRSNPAPQSVPISITRMTQAMLFQELQTRLSTLDTADEINVNKEEEEYTVAEETAPTRQKDRSKTSSSSMFGMSVSMLSELQASIVPTNAAPQQDSLVENYGD